MCFSVGYLIYIYILMFQLSSNLMHPRKTMYKYTYDLLNDSWSFRWECLSSPTISTNYVYLTLPSIQGTLPGFSILFFIVYAKLSKEFSCAEHIWVCSPLRELRRQSSRARKGIRHPYLVLANAPDVMPHSGAFQCFPGICLLFRSGAG